MLHNPVLAHGVLFDTGLPVVLVLGCVHALEGGVEDAMLCSVLLLLERIRLGSHLSLLLACLSALPVAIVYAFSSGCRAIWARRWVPYSN